MRKVTSKVDDAATIRQSARDGTVFANKAGNASRRLTNRWRCGGSINPQSDRAGQGWWA